MSEYICALVVCSLIVGFLLGRWRVKDYCGDAIISESSETCTFALDIPADSISQYSELVFRVVTEEEHRNV